MGRGFVVISALAQLTRLFPHCGGVRQVASDLGRDRSQVSRTLKALAEKGLVTRGDDLLYRLSWDWYAAAQELTMRRLHLDGLTVLDQLSSETHEACFLGTLYGDSTVTIVESVPPSSRLIGSWIGRAYPAFCSDAGQATLWDATDEEVRAVFATTEFHSVGPNSPGSVEDFLRRLSAARIRGYAVVDQEAEPNLYSVSAPVWDFRGEVVAAVQIVGERQFLEPRTAWLGERCGGAAAEISRVLAAPESIEPL